MLNYLLSIQDNTFLSLDVIHLEKFNELLLRFALNVSVVVVIVRLLYYPVARRKD